MDEPRSCRPAVVGWTVVAATVAGYDAWALSNDRETLSGAFWRARRHHHGRFLAIGIWIGLTWHLMAGDKRLWIPFSAAVTRTRNPRAYLTFVGRPTPTNDCGYPKRRLRSSA